MSTGHLFSCLWIYITGDHQCSRETTILPSQKNKIALMVMKVERAIMYRVIQHPRSKHRKTRWPCIVHLDALSSCICCQGLHLLNNQVYVRGPHACAGEINYVPSCSRNLEYSLSLQHTDKENSTIHHMGGTIAESTIRRHQEKTGL